MLHFTFTPNRQTHGQPQLSDMFECIKGKLEALASERHFPWEPKPANLANMRTFDNQTPLVVAICHPQVTDNIIRYLLNGMRNNLEDPSHRSSSEPSVDQTQVFMAIEQVARRGRGLSNYDHLQPVLDACDANIFNQLFHFPCRYDNVSLLKWLVEQSSKLKGRSTHHTRPSGKFDLNKTEHPGYTPLLTAVFYGSPDCIEEILKVSICLQKNVQIL